MMDAIEKIVILGAGAFIGARYLARRISNNSGGQAVPKVPEPKNTGIVPPDFSVIPEGVNGNMLYVKNPMDNLPVPDVMRPSQTQLMQQMAQFRTVFS